LLANAKIENKNIEILQDLDKEEYYSLLNKSKLMVSTTSEENFGYCTVEALTMGCQVLLPNAFSNPEIVEQNNKLLYDDYDELFKKIPIILKAPIRREELRKYVEPYELVVKQWLKIMKG